MKRSFLFILLTVVGLASKAYAGAASKVDPYLSIGAPSVGKAFTKGVVKDSNRTTELISLFLKSTDTAATTEAVNHLGGRVRLVVGNIISADLPPTAVTAIAARAEVTYVEAAKPLAPSNDLAANEINAREVLSGSNLPQPYTGSGVIVGIVDTGIDLTHSDFRDANGKSRVLAAWDQKATEGTPPAELEQSYGVECDQAMIASQTCPMKDESGHGTHIAGTAAGRHDRYGGIAPDANIIAVRYRSELEFGNGYAEPLFSTTICEAAYYVFKKAEALGMPAVVNLSLGTHIGAHDGTSLFEECLDGLIEGATGRALVAAAGNETSTESTYTGLHAGVDVSGSQAVNFALRSFEAGRFFYIDVWGQPGNNLSVGLAVHNGSPGPHSLVDQSKLVALGDATAGTFLAGQVAYQINAHEIANPLNQKPHIGVTINVPTSVASLDKYSFDLVLSGTGHADAWAYPDKPATVVDFTTVAGDKGQPWSYVAGDRRMSIAIPATARNVIAVGAYTTRDRWERNATCCQVNFALGELLPFSSVGPAADVARVGVKPELAAPGAMIASALSRDAQVDPLLVMPDGTHVLQAGTSMAAPFVSGAIALMFSANPSLTRDDVKRYLIENTYVDDNVGAVPNDAWGYGKLDVLKAVEAAVTGGASQGAGNAALSLPGASSVSGHGGCGMLPDGSADPLLLTVMIAVPVVWLRRRRHYSHH